MDPLDDVFSAMRVHSAVYARIQAHGRWGLSLAGGPSARFGLVVQGACLLQVEGHPEPVPLTTGDCFVIARGTPYVLCDELTTPRVRCADVVREKIGGLVELGEANDSHESLTVICGWFTFDVLSARPLMELMPALLHVRIDEARTRALQATLQLLALETETPGLGSSMVVSRLADVIFVQAIRAHVAASDGASSGWLSALSDRRLSSSLRAIHNDLGHGWTVEEMAGVANMSRSAFAVRFKRIVGEAPMDYLTRWRMFHASSLLRQSQSAVGEIAALVGYESEAAFNKAFKRVMGMPPGAHRRIEHSAKGLAVA
jgi:AraC-like DNA-binding protein